MTPEMQEQLKQLTGGREITELSEEERREVFQKMRAQRGGGQAGPGGAAGGPGGMGAGAPSGMGAGAPSGMGAGAPEDIAPAGPGGNFTPEQRRAATLPAPPEKGSDVDILLRPGLLADAEVIVQEMKDVLYVPYQAVFDSPQGQIVYFWRNNRLEARPVETGARSESQVVIVSGLEEGDMISLEPPEGSRPTREKKKKGGQAPPSPGLPGAGGGRPGGGM